MGNLNKYVISKIKTEWEDVANALCYETNVVEAIKSKYDNPKESCKELLKDWLKTNNGVGPKVWSTLLDKLGKVDKLTTARKEILKDLEAVETPQSSAALSLSNLKVKILSLSKWLPIKLHLHCFLMLF